MEGNFDQHFMPVLGEPEDDESTEQRVTSEQSKCPFREQDIYLPIANVARIMKNAVPQSGKIAKDAKECVQECVSEFISFITSEASERCAQEKRKTINGEDVLFAMATLGFDPYIEPLKIYLQKYRDLCVHGTIKPYAEAQQAQVEQFKKASAEIQQTLKEEKVAAFVDPHRSDVTGGVDLVNPFTPTQFSDMLVASDDAGNVFSTQEGTIDPQIEFS